MLGEARLEGSGQNGAARMAASEGYRDLLTAVCLFTFAIGGFVFINPNGAAVYPGDGGLTWRTLPFAYSAGLALLAAIYALQSLRRIRAERAVALAPHDAAAMDAARTVFIRRTATLVLLLVFASLLQVIGLAILAPVFLFLLFRLYKRGSLRGDIALSVIGGACLWFLFVPVLKLNLAGGALDPVTPALLGLLSAVEL